MIYDVIIIGAGPAGLACAIYSGRYKLKTLVLSKEFGGDAAKAHIIENYPGFKSVTGLTLMNKFKEHALQFKAKIIDAEARKIKKKGKNFLVYTPKKIFEGKTILLALGTERRKLDIPGEDEFMGKGVSFCATCDAAFFRNKAVAVVGGSDAAGVEALLLADYAKKVYIIYRKSRLRAEPITSERIRKSKKIEVIYSSNVIHIYGDAFVRKLKLDTGKVLPVEGVFVEIGGIPAIAIAKPLGVKTDKEGLIVVNAAQETNVPGVYAAGDITTGSNNWRQVITAAAEGSLAANSIYNYVTSL